MRPSTPSRKVSHIPAPGDVLAGASVVASAGVNEPFLAGATGYAIPGGIFFLVSALRLGRTAEQGAEPHRPHRAIRPALVSSKPQASR
ncbi:hypothetical protein DY218_03230 [Streptomyces triticagri]|uniref:Uncharacterized protein n=1 Tax=Streptomyces triticagri TaxID=2293568 RepID=A0A372MB67_9ACTN|nr:hypothetical protein DY218_03230 [Streptomyces triticagri]